MLSAHAHRIHWATTEMQDVDRDTAPRLASEEAPTDWQVLDHAAELCRRAVAEGVAQFRARGAVWSEAERAQWLKAVSMRHRRAYAPPA